MGSITQLRPVARNCTARLLSLLPAAAGVNTWSERVGPVLTVALENSLDPMIGQSPLFPDRRAHDQAKHLVRRAVHNRVLLDTTFDVPTYAEAYKYAAYDGLQRLAATSTSEALPRS